MIESRTITRLLVITGAAAILLSGLSVGLGAEKDPARIIPADCFLMVNVPSVDKLVASFKKTNVYGLYKEPAMRRFIEPAEKNLRKLLEDELKRGFKGAGVKASLDSLPWPKGRVTLAMRMAKGTIKVPVYDWENSDGSGPPKILKYEEHEISAPRVIALADMGSNAEAARKMISKVITHGVEERGIRRLKKTVRGVQLSILLRPGDKRTDDDAAVDKERPIFGFKGDTWIFSTDLKLVRDVLGLMDGADRDAVSSNADYRKVMRKRMEREGY